MPYPRAPVKKGSTDPEFAGYCLLRGLALRSSGTKERLAEHGRSRLTVHGCKGQAVHGREMPVVHGGRGYSFSWGQGKQPMLQRCVLYFGSKWKQIEPGHSRWKNRKDEDITNGLPELLSKHCF